MLRIQSQTAFEYGGEKGEMYYPVQAGMLKAVVGQLQRKIEIALNRLEEVKNPDEPIFSAINELQVAKKAVIHALNDVATSEAGIVGRSDLFVPPSVSWSQTKNVPIEEQIEAREDLFSRRAE